MVSERPRAFVVAGLIGQGSGIYLASALLCRQLQQCGFDVTAFAQSVDWGTGNPDTQYRTVRPLIRAGYRWDLPARTLSRQVTLLVRAQEPEIIVVMGITTQARYLLKSSIASQLIIWELTNANQGNKFVDKQAVVLLHRCRAVLSPSPLIDRNIRQSYGYKGRILRLPFWIEDSSVGPALSPPENPIDFLYLGRRDKEKGLCELVRATSGVAQTFPSIRVVIGGSGGDEPYSSLVKELGMERNVTFNYFRSQDEVAAALARSRFLVLPSYHEGYPLVLLEAAQASVPFISTAVGGVPDLLKDSEAGVLCQPRDVGGLAESMTRLMEESPEHYRRRREAAYKLFQDSSSKEVVRDALTAVLETLRNEQ